MCSSTREGQHQEPTTLIATDEAADRTVLCKSSLYTAQQANHSFEKAVVVTNQYSLGFAKMNVLSLGRLFSAAYTGQGLKYTSTLNVEICCPHPWLGGHRQQKRTIAGIRTVVYVLCKGFLCCTALAKSHDRNAAVIV